MAGNNSTRAPSAPLQTNEQLHADVARHSGARQPYGTPDPLSWRRSEARRREDAGLPPHVEHREDDALAPAQGTLTALVLAIVVWALVVGLVLVEALH